MNDGKVSKHYTGSGCFENLKIKEGNVAVKGAGNEIKLYCFMLSIELQVLQRSYIYTAKVWLFFFLKPLLHTVQFFQRFFPQSKILKHKVETNPLKILNLFTTAFIFYMIM